MARTKKRDEDLFKESTMTFGEHLEELRVCLFRALVGLAIGTVFGLFVGSRVVEAIQIPLRNALIKYYQDQSINRIEEKLAELQGDDEPLPWKAEQIEDVVNEHGLLPEETYVEKVQFLRLLKQVDPELFDSVELPAEERKEKLRKSELVRVFVWRPIEDDSRIQPISIEAHEAFMTYIKASLVVGVLLASPWIFFQIWSFVAAGLYSHERQYIHVYLPFSLGLFLAGAALAFFFVLEPVLNFLFYFNSTMGINPDPRISKWLGFVLVLPLGFGIAFQLPLVMLFIERIGIVDVTTYLMKWRIAVLVIFVLAMFLTPADPYSMILMAVPLTVLYFGGILLCKYMPRRRSPFDDADKDQGPKKTSAAEKPQGGGFSLTLRLLIAAVLVVVLFGWKPLKKAYLQRTAVARIQELDGKVYYDYQLDESGEPTADAKPPGPGVLRVLLGIDFLADVVAVDLTGTDATAQDVSELQEALPDCTIVSGPQ